MNIWKHFVTITRHRHKVIRHCFLAGIFWQGLRHDLSKYSPAEFIPGVKYYLGDQSPNVKERQIKGFSRAWLHHQGRNKHHFEYWVDYDVVTHQKQPVRMPTKYLIEMFCDRVAASKIYYGSEYDEKKPYEYFNRGIKSRIMHPETSKQLEELLIMLRDKGERETFSYIKNVIRVQGKKDRAHWK
ncbi:MAG: catalase [Lachnospiraceae bacterium]|nr:catalase [Lachnospiraceae bacterium]